jgi:anti-sigma factor RsiW
MKNACKEWKDQLIETALTGTAPKVLEEHLQSCADCGAQLKELRARRERLDVLLPLVAQRAEPSRDFRARVLAAAESAREEKRARPWRVWTLAGATAVAVVALMAGPSLLKKNERMVPQNELEAAQKLAEWRAPSDSLLRTPGQELMKSTPKLGNSYLNIPAKANEEE